MNPNLERRQVLNRVDGAATNLQKANEATRWEAFRQYLITLWSKVTGLGEDFAEKEIGTRASEAGRTDSEARKTVEEAISIAAERAIQQKLAGLTISERMNSIVTEIFQEDGLPDDAKILKLQLFLENSPEMIDAFKRTMKIVAHLRENRGAQINLSPAILALSTEDEEDSEEAQDPPEPIPPEESASAS